MNISKSRNIVLLGGDIVILWTGLFLTVAIRYGFSGMGNELSYHITPFGVIFALWIIFFYVAGLYDIKNTNDIPTMLKYLLYAIAFAGAAAVSIFYFATFFVITPKTNLFIDLAITTVLLSAWRMAFTQYARSSNKLNVLLLGTSAEIDELSEAISKYSQLGYRIACRASNPNSDTASIIREETIDIVVATKDVPPNSKLVNAIYATLHSGIRFIDSSAFYEEILGKIPVTMISKVWFLENIAETKKKFFKLAKRSVDLLFSLALGAVTIILFPAVAALIKLDSKGPVLIKQKRVGFMGSHFVLYKFRTMVATGPGGLAEQNGAVWAEKNDSRITRAGRFLRSTRIDELPQMWNVLKGELSFVGPRPERPEFVEELRKEIPFYDMRHMARPGLSGWAQVNPPYYYGSKDEAMLKLQYDLYYIKNRDLGLDIAIMLRTLAVILSRSGR